MTEVAPQNLAAHASHLTFRERSIERDQVADLAVGYPELPPPAWLAEVADLPLHRLLDRFRAAHPDVKVQRHTSLPSAVAIEERLILAALGLFGLPETLARNSFVTFSGSVARAARFAAARPGRRSRRLRPGPSLQRIVNRR